MTLAVTEAPDSHRGPAFLAGSDGQRGQTALTCFFVGFCTDFVTSVRVLVAFVGILALAGYRPAGARKPQGAPSPWLHPWSPASQECQICPLLSQEMNIMSLFQWLLLLSEAKLNQVRGQTLCGCHGIGNEKDVYSIADWLG